MDRKQTSRSKHLDFIILDLLCIEISFLLAYYIRLGNDSDAIRGNYYIINILIIMIHLAIAFMSECYSGILRRNNIAETKNVLAHNIGVMSCVLVVLFFWKQSESYSRILLGLFFIFSNITMLIERIVRKSHLCKIAGNREGLSQMLLIVNSRDAKKCIEGLRTYNYSPYYVSGIVLLDRDATGKSIEKIPVVSSKKGMYDYVCSNVVDEVFIGSEIGDEEEVFSQFIKMGVKVHVSIEKIVSNAPNSTIEKLGGLTVLTASIGHMTVTQRVVKRLFDIFVSLIGILVTGILTIILGPIIKIQSPGPIFFSQVRVGKNGRKFKMFKFRSMYMDAEERKKELMSQNKMNGLMFKMDDDPRIIPIGKFIRKTSLDEFPQFVNILFGDMSLVGTRPPTLDEYTQYEQHHKSRLAIKPGLTGMWQVSGRSDITDFEEIVRLDNEYIKNFSLSNDLKIIAKTFLVVLKRKGSE